MDVFEAVDSRISCRWFLDKPVDSALVRDLIAGAARAASGGNLQPWQVYALTGAALAELKRQVAAAIAGGDPRQVDAEYPIYPKTMWEPYRSRREHHGVQLYGALKIDRSDAAARLDQYKRNYEFFNAPVALFIAIDRRLGPGQWADLGGYIHALMYLARGHGLDTCAQESWARMHRIVGPYVKMPPETDAVLRGLDQLRRPRSSGQQFPFAARRATRVLPFLWFSVSGAYAARLSISPPPCGEG
jgi:nitroreductase